MFRTIRICLTALLLTSLFWSCTDHLSRPASPQRLRLKTTTSTFDGTTTQTSFEYDAQNRQVAYSQGDVRGTITYDAQGQYQQIDETRPNGVTRTRFTYQSSAQGREVTAIVYGVTPVNGRELESLIETRTYNFDANNQLTRSSYTAGELIGASTTFTTYSYTGTNVTTVEAGSNRTVYTYLYEFDDKLNPYYGLIGPGIDEVRRFSRNNPIKYTPVPSAGNTYSYEYNVQGLPTRIDNTTLTYESY